MKLMASIIKSFKENMRDWKVLSMVLLFAPFFVILMYLFYGGSSTVYKAGVLNLDKGTQSAQLIRNIENTRGQDKAKLFKTSNFNSIKEMKLQVKDKNIDIGICIPVNYSKELPKAASSKTNNALVKFYGSMSNMRYTLAAILAGNSVYSQGTTAQKITLPSYFSETFLEKKKPVNEFDGYVPGLISLAVLMVLFTAAASIVKENDKKTIIRLKLSRLGAFNFLGGIGVVQAVIAIAAIVLSYWTALAVGYKPAGSFGTVLVVGIVSSFSMVAVSLIVASFLNTIFDVLTIGCFPFFVMMFFSGCMFPLPKMNMFSVLGHSFGITDILPLTHTVAAFNKILNYGAGISDVGFEIFMITVLTIIYFVLGIALYQKRKLSKA
jgi:ABC-2 type transport system permease protein